MLGPYPNQYNNAFLWHIPIIHFKETRNCTIHCITQHQTATLMAPQLQRSPTITLEQPHCQVRDNYLTDQFICSVQRKEEKESYNKNNQATALGLSD
jgi:hypothetical protein